MAIITSWLSEEVGNRYKRILAESLVWKINVIYRDSRGGLEKNKNRLVFKGDELEPLSI